MSDKITIAIDGYSSCGKSTLARELAKSLHYVFIDSGAMYRGVTLFAIQNGCIVNQEVNRRLLISKLNGIELKFVLNPDTKSPELLLNGKNVEAQIRTPQISAFVSDVAAVKEVRHKLVAEQQAMGLTGGIVMDGRDIGSVVFPNAELKLFVTADIETRVDRRYEELIFRGTPTPRDEVRANLTRRDFIDSTRAESPLIQTEDAIVLDNTYLSKSEQLQLAQNHVERAISTLA